MESRNRLAIRAIPAPGRDLALVIPAALFVLIVTPTWDEGLLGGSLSG